MYKIMAYIERDPETGLYVGTVPEISGAHTQAETLDELQKNLKEVVWASKESKRSSRTMFGRNGFRGEKTNTWIYRNSTNWGISLSKLQIINAKTMERLLR